MVAMRRLWPAPDAPLSPDEVVAAYATDRPGVRINFVSSLDGAVEVDGYSRGLSTPADRDVFHVLRGQADAVMVGAGTLRHEKYGPVAPKAVLVVVSGSLDLDPDARPFVEAPIRPVVLTHAAAPAERRAALAAVADIIDCGDTVIDPSAGLSALRTRGLGRVLCEGGPHLFGALLAADLVDELCLTVSPLLVGSGPGRIVTDGRRNIPLTMSLAHILADGDTLFTRYTRAN
jgi:riboflavin biosynthesis pyrimidine reductase